MSYSSRPSTRHPFSTSPPPSRGHSFPRGNRRPSHGGMPRFTRPAPISRTIMDGVGSVIKQLDMPEAAVNKKDPLIKLEDIKALASYSWKSSVIPTIIVPGCPDVWMDKPLPIGVSRDSGRSFIHQNAARWPDCPLEPLFRAVQHYTPDFNFSSVDIVTDRNGLRKLWWWLRGLPDNDFRIDLQLAGDNTVLFTRWEPVDMAHDTYGYGQEFHREATQQIEECRDTSGHHRIITYNFEGIQLLVRSVIDACLKSEETHPSANERRSTVGVHATPNVDDLSAAFGSLSVNKATVPVNNATRPVNNTAANIIKVNAGGVLVPQASFIKLKTRSRRNIPNFDWLDNWFQAFMSGIPTLYLAVHEEGIFNTVWKMPLGGSSLEKWERDAQVYLKQLRVVLGMIRDVVIEKGNGAKLSLVCRGGELKVYERTDKKEALPEDAIGSFKNM